MTALTWLGVLKGEWMDEGTYGRIGLEMERV